MSAIRLSSTLKMEDEALVTKKQGIISILGSDSERSSSSSGSLRRTLSADMSSKKWLSQHGLKKTASSEQFLVSIADSCETASSEQFLNSCKTASSEQFLVSIADSCSSDDYEETSKKEVENPAQFDIWSSILSQKSQQDSNKNLPAPYIHPLVKRSASSLSEKSLQICTESLGSETGSDGFSSYPSSETGDMEEDKEDQDQRHEQQQSFEGFYVEKAPRIYTSKYKKLPERSFPPPIPSLTRQDGASLRMRTVRDNGRLVLEAVSVPSQNNFRAERQDGRLVLTFNSPEMIEPEDEDEDEDEDESFQFDELELENFGEEDEETETDEEEEEEEEETEEEETKLPSGVINFHRLALMVNNKPMGLVNNRNQTWPKKINEIVKFEEDIVIDKLDPTATPLAQSLPPRPRVGRLIPSPRSPVTVTTAASSLNAYEYYWKRPKPITNVFNPIPHHSPSGKNPTTGYEQQQQQQQGDGLMVLRENEKGEYLVRMTKGCKEPRRSIIFWEPYCIATS
ncbi:protein FAF-like, chloroplastic [Carica papaya]|uniref:protein FAF-like, chloroplastic n=1 Tax=Carica papaya TaxID=3649 RepID=UPI000B8CFE43|nr:protein FAF-like, chloroplastic [Carica papaya]